MSALRYLSVCSGIEAASVAWKPLGWECAGVSEIDKFPRAVLQHRLGAVPVDGDHRWQPGQNFTPLFGDFTKIEAHHVGPVDLLVGGTPCQSFSIAGKRLGLDDPRGNLTLEFFALAERVRPTWIVWENVPGVLSHDDGRTFGTVLGLMGECGFRWAYRTLDAQYCRTRRFGRAVPQRRRRVFLVGYSGAADIHPRAVLFDRESLRGNPAPRREAGQRPAPTLAARTRGGGGLGTDFDCDGGLIAGTEWPASVAPTLNAHFGEKQGLEDQHIRGGAAYSSPAVANPLTARMHKGINTTADEGQTPIIQHGGGFDGADVAHSLRAEGFDASEDGTGRGTPIVPVQHPPEIAGTLKACGGKSGLPNGAEECDRMVPVQQPFSIMPMNSGKDYKARETDVAQPIMAGGPVGGNQGGDVVATQAVAIHSDAIGRDGISKTAGADAAGVVRKRNAGMGIAQDGAMYSLTTGQPHAIALQDTRGMDKAQNGKGWSDDGSAYTVDALATQGVVQPVAFDTTQITSPSNYSQPEPGDPCHPLAAGAHPPAIAFAQNTRDEVRLFNGDGSIAGALSAEPGMKQTTYVAFTAKDHGGDAVEGISPTLRAGGHTGSHANAGVMPAIAFAHQAGGKQTTLGATDDGTCQTLGAHQTPAIAFKPGSSADARSIGAQEEVACTLEGGGGGNNRQAIAFQERGRADGRSLEHQEGIAYALTAPSGGGRAQERNIASAWGVRRLTPRECERLQGFPDDYTAIPWGKKTAEECPDGPRYKALGNSMAVPVMEWIGERIEAVRELAEE